MRTNIDLDEFLPTMDAPDKVYQLFESLGFKVLDSHLKTNPSVYNLPIKEAALVEKIYAVSNYDRRFQILLFKLKEENKEAIRTIPEKILREVDFPFIIFTPDFKTYTFTLVEKVREGPGEFKRKLTKLVVDSSQPYHTDKEILGSLALSVDTKNPVEVYKLFQSAFSVEKVTKKFFTEYREVFERLVGEVTKQNKHLKFTLFSRDASVENFVKILLGRLMFLYFIQKRGWLNCFDGWGSGDKKFLYNKFKEAKTEKKNYFKDYLEPLFFDTLNNPRRDKPDQATQFGGRIPFLNGGLFEPEYDYQDIRNHILLENSTFDDVFSVFEKYNFTVKEDEPLEKEVAIDPEMLGKVFENLLEENLRKGKGTYYTPREIVHYMCHESLINYLASEINLDQDVIRNFLDREQSLEKKETLSSAIREKAKEIDEKLADIKVLDPACGSGAFLVGMLHEVINARLSLNRELGRSFSEYELKKATIQNNIYGVDIDPGASEIAKLRLWLTLVVDHNLSEIEPLPNLDYKIMVGNSLLDEFMGVKLFNLEKARQQTNGKKLLKLFEDDVQQVSMFEDENKANILKALQQLHALYFKESDPERKKQIRTQIDKTEFVLIEATVNDEVSKLEIKTKGIIEPYLSHGIGIPAKEAERISKLSSQQAQILETFNEIKKSNVKPFFLFQLHFSDVFERKGGFDVVIANPPYVRVHKQNKAQKEILKRIFTSPYKDFDIYIVFIEQAIRLLKDNGVLCFITPDKYLIREYGEKIRRYLFDYQLVEFYDVSRANDLFGAAVYPLITIVKRKHEKGNTRVRITDSIAHIRSPKTDYLYPQSEWEENGLIELIQEGDLDIINKITNQSDKLKDFVEKDIFCGTPRAKDYYEWTKGLTTISDNQRVRVLVCQNLRPYKIDHSLLVRTLGEKIKSPFFDNSTKLITTGRWNDFLSNPKILIRGNDTRITAVIDNEPSVFIGIYAIKFSDENKRKYIKYILALLNSNLYQWIFSKQNPSLKIGGEYFSINASQILRLPFKYPSVEVLKQIDNAIDGLLSKTHSDNSHIEEYQKQIDKLVYKLYGLTQEEITIIENKN